MKMKKITALLCATTIFGYIPALSAQEYRFTYSKLFSQLKYNVSEKHEKVKTGIFFVDADTNALCDIEKAWMEKEEKYQDLTPNQGKELIIPLDNNLREANPLIFVQTPWDKRCDFSMVVMTREPLSGKVYYNQIEALLPQMQSLLEDLGGMFAAWFTPKVEGLTFEFPEGTKGSILFSNGRAAEITAGRAHVLLSDLQPDDYITLPQKTIRVLPWIPSVN